MRSMADNLMKIAWLTPYPVDRLVPFGATGVRRAITHPASWIVNLSDALARTGEVDLHLITDTPLVARTQVIRLASHLTVHCLRNSVPFTRRGWPPYFPAEMLTGFARGISQMTRRVRELGPDLIHAHGTEHSYAMAASRMGRPYVISMQGLVAQLFKSSPSLRFRLVRRYEDRTIRRGRYFFCRTAFDTSFVRDRNPSARIFHVPEAMNPVFFDDPWSLPPGRRILFVGSAGKWKGLGDLVQAVGLARRAVPDIQLDVVGHYAPPEQAAYRAQAACGGTDSWLSFLGFQSSESFARLHRECAAFVLPSLNDNSPNTLAEAMVSGMPVIATRVGGVPSMVDDETTGLLVPPADPERLANAIVRLLTDDAERRRLGAGARRVGERHRPERVAAQTVACYREMLESKRAGANPEVHR